ncbi:MAG: hypothetical protein J4432_03035 [DPANN group archaeon]|nr:hypothetical protein [DPANN group archaeon]
MVHHFKYKKLTPSRNKERKYPVIPVTYKTGDIEFEVISVVDSGATSSYLPYSLAMALGLSKQNKIETETMGGKISTATDRVIISIPLKNDRPVRVETYVNFPCSPKDDHYAHPLLGRQGFFDKFIVTFDDKNEKLTLKKNE